MKNSNLLISSSMSLLTIGTFFRFGFENRYINICSSHIIDNVYKIGDRSFLWTNFLMFT